MGLSSMRSVFADDSRQSKCWEVGPFVFGVSIIIFTALSEMRTLSQVIQYDLNYAIEIFTAICPGVLCAVKGVRLWTHRADLYWLLRRFKYLWDSANSRDLLDDNMKEAARSTQFMRFCYTIVVTVLVTSYAVRPYILLIDHRLRPHPNESFDYSMTVYPSSYSFSTDTPFSYFLCVTYEQIVIVFVALYWISCDTLFAQLTTHICIHYRVCNL
uniref:Olfactory receptor 100 n=1 Tax=Aulacocentrum confusum TaxID=2767324 RepID=A0A7G8Z9B9_9HYME|nr:olfactory receptor 100 [Aulacocentrum confusum]